MDTILFHDVVRGTSLVFKDRQRQLKVTETSALTPGGRHSALLDLDDIDRLLAVREHAFNPIEDIAEYFRDVEHFGPKQAQRAAEAFVISAGSLADIVYGS